MSFTIIGTQVGMQQAQPSLTVTFGNVAPHTTSEARWLLITPVMGEFLSFNATFQQLGLDNNPQLSLFNNITIHALIHEVYLDPTSQNNSLPDFLVNDIPNPLGLPDTVYSSQNQSSKFDVRATVINSTSNIDIISSNINSTSGSIIVVNTTVVFNESIFNTSSSWFYVRFDNPIYRISPAPPLDPSLYNIVEIKRPDGSTIMLPENGSYTNKILHLVSGNVSENYLHIFDQFNTNSYTVTYQTTATPCSSNPCFTGVSCINTDATILVHHCIMEMESIVSMQQMLLAPT